MNVLFVNHVSSKKYGGAERVLDNLVSGISAFVPNPTLVLQKNDRAEIEEWDCRAVARVTYFNFGTLGGASKLTSLFLMLIRIVKGFFYFSYLIRKNKIDIVCANSLIAGTFVALPARLFCRKFIYYEHNIATQRKNHLIGLALHPVARLATDIVCISGAVKSALIDERIDKEKLHLIHNGYDFTTLDACSKQRQLPTRHSKTVLRVGMVANFIPWKRHDRFIEIIDALGEHNPDIRIEAVIVGGCLPGNEPYYRAIEETVRRHEGKADIKMVGFQDCIADYFRSFDVLINPTDAEPFGLIFIEAMYLGCVVVGSCAGSSPEIICDGITGFVVDYDDQAAVIDTLSVMAADVSSRKNIGAAASQSVKERFSIDQQVNEFLKLLA